MLVIITPVMLLVLTLTFLTITTDIAVEQLTLVELVELYLLDLVLLVAVGYLLYRLMLRLVVHELPAALDELEQEQAEESRAGDDADEE